MRVAFNASATKKLLWEIVSRFGFASACEYCISSSSNVPNLSNISVGFFVPEKCNNRLTHHSRFAKHGRLGHVIKQEKCHAVVR